MANAQLNCRAFAADTVVMDSNLRGITPVAVLPTKRSRPIKHGSLTTYRKLGCKCPMCVTRYEAWLANATRRMGPSYLACRQAAQERMIERRRFQAMTQDELINELLADPRWEVMPDGRVLRDGIDRRTVESYGYYMVSYHSKKLRVNRIMYRKYKGPLIAGMHIDHIDDDRANNLPENLQQITPAANNRRIHRPTRRTRHDGRGRVRR